MDTNEIPRYVPGVSIENGIKLSSNEAALGPSSQVLTCIKEYCHHLHRYPEHDHSKLEQQTSKLLGLQAPQVLFGNGSDELLCFITREFLNHKNSPKNDEVIIANHTFSMYRIASMLAHAKVQTVPLRHWHFDLESIQMAIQKETRIIFLASPNNPTGTCIDPAQLKGFLDRLSNDVFVVLDEAYIDFADEKYSTDYSTLLSWHPKLILLRTMSKAYGLAGLRIGYAVAEQGIINALRKHRMPFNLNSLALRAAHVAFKDTEHYNQNVELVRKERARLTEAYAKMNCKPILSQANFITIIPPIRPEILQKFEGLPSADVLFRFLLQDDPPISIRSLGSFSLPEAVRITIATEAENNLVLERIRKAVL